MPTARELLEQADALMRRNRGRDSVQRASPALPVATPAPAQHASPAPAAAPDIPVLTDVVDVPPPQAAKADADVPVLTDMVSTPPEDALAEIGGQGEPSIWTDMPDEDKSILGTAPDSVVVVPPPTAPAAPPREAAPLAAMVSSHAEEHPPAAEAAPEIVEPAAPAEQAAASGTQPLDAAIEAELFAEPAAEPAPPVVAPMEIVASPSPPIAIAAASPHLAPVPLAAPEAAAAHGKPSDEERWQQLAEDVRMQVLQRIDIFTDTGLREQLGARLKPIVDRASADLVATINEHVGELLRTYVAEAIEREIERWRHDGDR